MRSVEVSEAKMQYDLPTLVTRLRLEQVGYDFPWPYNKDNRGNSVARYLEGDCRSVMGGLGRGIACK